MGRIFFQNKKDDAFRAASSYRQGRFKKYIACLLFLVLAVLAAWFIRLIGSKQVITEFSSEYEKMQLFYKLYPRNVQFEPGIFYHIGPQRIREDFRAKGLFLDEGIS